MTLKGRSQLVALAALGATLWGFPVIPSRGAHHWGQANENRIYPLTGLFPITVHHASYREGVLFRELFYERGIEVPMGSCCIGMVGYYSRQPLMDFHGLTDAATAKKKIRGRALPGHEKKASNQEVRERGIRIARWGGRNPKHLAEAAHLRFPKGSGVRRKGYSFVVWDPDLAATLEEKVPEIEFRTFPRWLDRYIRSMRKDEKPRKQVIEDLKWFRAYYFDHNDDPKRLRRIERWLRDSREREKKREPTEPKEQPSQR